MPGSLAKVTVDMKGMVRVLHGFSQRLQGLPMSVVGESISTSVLDYLQSEGNGSWEPLSPATLRRRPRRRGGQLLQDRGQLKAFQVWTGPDWVEVRSPAPYAGFHVTGTRNMPQRDFTDIDLGQSLETAAILVAKELTG
jgi:phage gpG-like protein